MKKGRLFFLLLAALLIIVVAGSGCGRQVADRNPAEANAAVPVTLARAEKGKLNDTVVVSGKLEACQKSDVVPKVSGKVGVVHVDVGSRVRAGQVLVTLENEDLAARVAQAEAGVNQAAASLGQAEAGLKSAQAALANAQSNYAVAEANYNRAKELLVAGAVSQAVFETQYELPYKQAKETAEGSAPAQVELAQAQIKQAQAAMANARAQLAVARQAYDDSFIRAPFGGVVTARNVEPGEMASSAVAAISMVNLDKVEVKATVGEDLINKLKVGQEVPVKVSAVSATPFTGVVAKISPAADKTTKAFPVEVQMDNPNHLLKPGMFAEMAFSRGQQESLLVPRDAVVKDGEKNYIWVVKDGRARRCQVQVGDSDGKQIIIVSGLVAGEEVVVAGQESLREGGKVTVAGRQQTTAGKGGPAGHDADD